MSRIRGQGLPLNTIIIAIIVVVVLVVIILIFTGQIAGVNRAAQEGAECRQLGGYCTSADTTETAAGDIVLDGDPCKLLGGNMDGERGCGSGMVCCTR